MSPRTTTGTSITGHGVWHPEPVLENEELCVAFNEFARRENAKYAAEIAAGTRQPIKDSTPEFIIKASGIITRYVHDKTGLLDPERMCPNIPDRPEEEISVQAEYAVNAAKRALERAGRTGEDVDLVVLGCSNLQRMYPAIAIEVQEALGARGYGYDMSLGCSAATGATIMASQAIQTGAAKCALVVVPELTTGHMNWRERDSHFIFGDASVALVVEPTDRAKPGSWEILSTRMMSKWSNNIRNNYGYLDRCDPETQNNTDKLFHQHGRRVYKDVVPLAAKFILEHIAAHELPPQSVARYWLHQANVNMNNSIAERVLGRPASREEAPVILDEYGNTASAGSLLAFSLHSEDLARGDFGVMCSFGAGYSLGSLLLQRT
ncbi:MAG: Beta-ketoacyl-acyl-carrier-protein synthase [Myxococcales bacterium]|nr:Beta-ketoacyl-acyl-carrier-protein synthase [Myxococcales bacterium]